MIQENQILRRHWLIYSIQVDWWFKNYSKRFYVIVFCCGEDTTFSKIFIILALKFFIYLDDSFLTVVNRGDMKRDNWTEKDVRLWKFSCMSSIKWTFSLWDGFIRLSSPYRMPFSRKMIIEIDEVHRNSIFSAFLLELGITILYCLFSHFDYTNSSLGWNNKNVSWYLHNVNQTRCEWFQKHLLDIIKVWSKTQSREFYS